MAAVQLVLSNFSLIFIYFTWFIPWVFHLEIEWGKNQQLTWAFYAHFQSEDELENKLKTSEQTCISFYCKHNKLKITQSYILMNM